MKDARDYVALAEEQSGPIPRGVAPRIRGAMRSTMLDAARPDARIVNLETSITRRDDCDREKGIHYRVSPENAACLAAARIDVCALANNHVLDWGTAGLARHARHARSPARPRDPVPAATSTRRSARR